MRATGPTSKKSDERAKRPSGPPAYHRGVARSRRWSASSLVLVFAVAAGLGLRLSRAGGDVPRPGVERLTLEREGHVGSDRCGGCHREAHATWHGSYHRTMTQDVSTLLGPKGILLPPFRGEVVDASTGLHAGRDEAGLWIEIGDGATPPRRARVVMATGSHHMQLFWRATDDGRLEAFEHAWLASLGRWVPNESTFLRPPGEPQRYTWNRVCIKCHAVSGTPGWDPGKQEARSRAAELGIACEACHGSGRAHAEAMRSPWRRYGIARGLRASSSDIVSPSRLEGTRASELCGRCHGITVFQDEHAWVEGTPVGGPEHPVASWGRLVQPPMQADDPWLDALLEREPDYLEARFWPDGMVKITGREWGAVVQSPCATDPTFSCMTCHDVHGADPDDQLRTEARGDEVCIQCHAAQADRRRHSHHETVECQDCHMPHTTYGLLQAVRSHQIDSPSVQVNLDTGRPNACNACHLDQTLHWSAVYLARWFGQAMPSALDPDALPAGVQWLLGGDAMVRALAAWYFGWSRAWEASGRSWMPPVLATALADPYPAIRWTALQSLRAFPGWESFAPDLSGSSTEREAAVDLVRRRWNASGEGSGALNLLQREDGSFDETAARALFEARDRRAVWLAE